MDERDTVHMRYQWYGETLCRIPADPKKVRFTHIKKSVNCPTCLEKLERTLP